MICLGSAAIYIVVGFVVVYCSWRVSVRRGGGVFCQLQHGKLGRQRERREFGEGREIREVWGGGFSGRGVDGGVKVGVDDVGEGGRGGVISCGGEGVKGGSSTCCCSGVVSRMMGGGGWGPPISIPTLTAVWMGALCHGAAAMAWLL